MILNDFFQQTKRVAKRKKLKKDRENNITRILCKIIKRLFQQTEREAWRLV